MNTDVRDRLNESALRVTALTPERVGYWFARFREAEGISESQLAEIIGTDLRGLAVLALCQMPRRESFADDITTLSQLVPVNVPALANVLRQELGFSEWASPIASAASNAAWLLAAHEAEQPPPGHDADDPQ